MHRRQFIRTASLALGALTLAQRQALALLTQQPWKITMLSETLGVFTERGGTIAFWLGKTGIVVVDSQFPEQSGHLIEELKKKSGQPFELLINTHHHGDHSGGNIAFKELVPHVLAHANSKINQENVARQNKTEEKQLYPDQTYTHVWCHKSGKETICLHYFGAGHTNGDSLVYFKKNKVVHCGDLVFNRRHPYVDRSAGANMKSWIQVLDKALSTFPKNTRYVFGHSGTGYDIVGTAADVKAFQQYLQNTLRFVEEQISAGKTKEDILKATFIPGSEEWKGDGIQRPLTAAWEELTQKAG